MTTRRGRAVPSNLLTLVLLTGCAAEVSSPATTQSRLNQRVTEVVDGHAIVMRAAAQSGADQIASIFAAEGDSSYMRRLDIGRRRHIAMLDSVLRSDASLVSGLPLSYDEAVIVLDENNLGPATVIAATTSIGFGSNGNSVSLTGQGGAPRFLDRVDRLLL